MSVAAESLKRKAEDSGDRTISFASFLGNDSEGAGAEEEWLTFSSISLGNAVGGTVSIVGTDVIFSPALNYNGSASFEYTVQDNGQSGSPLVNDFKTDVGEIGRASCREKE